jgi:hypothetical protein
VVFTVSRRPDGTPQFGNLRGELTNASFTLPELPLDFVAADVSFALSDACLDVTRFEGALVADTGFSLLPALRYAALARPRTQAAAAGAIGISQKRDRSVRFEVTGLFVDDSLLAKLPDPFRQVVTDAKPRGFVDVAGEWSYTPDGQGISMYEALLNCADVGFSAGWPFESVTGDVAVEGRMEGSTSSLSLDANLASISVGGRKMANAHVRLVQEPDEVRLEQFETRMFGGILEGQGRMFFGGKPSYAFSVSARGMSLSDALDKAFGFRKEGLSGTLGARIEILCLTGKDSDTVGSAAADVQNGELWEVPVILAMMNVLNLRLPERTQFNSAHTLLKWNNKGTYISELSMISDPATIFGQGSIDANGNLDMLFYSRPGRIPIVSLLAGEVGKNIARVRMTGTFAQPKTTLVPSGLLGKLIEVFRPRRKGEHK